MLFCSMKKHDLNSCTIDREDVIKHDGIVSKIHENTVLISLQGNVNCETCVAKNSCNALGSDAKEIELSKTNQTFKLNEKVIVILEKQLGLKAVFWAYVFPFILMFLTLLISSNIFKEWVAGLISLFVLIPYYLTVYFFKNSFKEVFKIFILKDS